MKLATGAFLAEIDKKAEEMKERILNTKDETVITGTVYYMSENGCDDNDGLSPETAWKTNAKITAMHDSFKEGDGVFFKRGETFRGQIITAPGVTYAAYGEGAKPNIFGWEKNLADPDLWVCFNAEKHIWKYTEPSLDVGTLVFNDGEEHSIKLIPSYNKDGKYVLRDTPDILFVMEDEMKRDLDIFSPMDEKGAMLNTSPDTTEGLFPVPSVTQNDYGTLYLRCDRGNPGEVFRSIELLPKRNTFAVRSNKDVRIDNLCIKYCGAHGIGGGGHVVGLHITNCEIGWIGGSIQHFNSSNPARCGIVTRYGNGVEIYGGCEDYIVDNCYIYEVYDAGVTHQVTAAKTKDIKMYDVKYTNNLIERCVYNIEYFLSDTAGTSSLMKNYEISGNILRFAGYGWGRQRYNPDTPAHIKSWDSANPAENYVIHHNIFDRSTFRHNHIVALDEKSLPEMHDNIYIQNFGGSLGNFGVMGESAKEKLVYDANADKNVSEKMGEKNGEVYYV